MRVRVYGLGGYDPSKPNNNLVDEYDDGMPGEPVDPTPEDRLAVLEKKLKDMEDRAAATSVTGDAAKIKDVITGKP